MNYMKPFRFWCQKVLPLVYDDSLSYYELLCKVVDYLNHMGADINELIQMVTDFQGLDLQDEVNKKLDEMAEDGTLDAMLAAYVKNYTKMLLCVSTYRDSVRTGTRDYCLAVSTDGGKTFSEIPESMDFADAPLGTDCYIAKIGNGWLFLATGFSVQNGYDLTVSYTEDFQTFYNSRPIFGFLALAQTMCSDAAPMVGSPSLVESGGKYYLMLSLPTATSYTDTNVYDMVDVHRTMGLYACEVEFSFAGGFEMNKAGDIFRINVRDHANVMDGDIKKLGDDYYLSFKDREDLTCHIAKSSVGIEGQFVDIINCVYELPYTEATHLTQISDTEALLYCTSYFHGSTSDQVTQCFGIFNSVTERLIYLGEPVRTNCHHFYQRGNEIDCGMRNPYPMVVDSDLYLILKDRYHVPVDIPTIKDSDIPFKYVGNPSNTIIQRASKYLYETYGVYLRLFPWVYYDITNSVTDPLYIGTDGNILVNAGSNIEIHFPGSAVRYVRTAEASKRFTISDNALLPALSNYAAYHESLENGLGLYVTNSVFSTVITIRGALTEALASGTKIAEKPAFISDAFYWMVLPLVSYDGEHLGAFYVDSSGDITYYGTDLESGTRVYASGSQGTK